MSYQSVLRAAGKFLDDQRATCVCLIETPGGLFIRWQDSTEASGLRVREFTHGELQEMSAAMEARRGPEDGRRPSIPDEGFQDMLRALGWELDQGDHSNIMVDEIHDGLFVTYMELDPRDSYMPTKHVAVFGGSERQELLNEAHSRRRIERESKWDLLKAFR